MALRLLLATYRLILFGAVTKAFIKLLTMFNLTYFGFFVNKKLATYYWLPAGGF